MSFATGLPSPPVTPMHTPTPRIILHLSPRSSKADVPSQSHTLHVPIVATGRTNTNGVHKKRRSATRSQGGSRDSGSGSSSSGHGMTWAKNTKRTRTRKVSRAGNGLTTGIGMSVPANDDAQASATMTVSAHELPAQRPRIIFRMGPRPPRIILHVKSRGETGMGSALVRSMPLAAGVGVQKRTA